MHKLKTGIWMIEYDSRLDRKPFITQRESNKYHDLHVETLFGECSRDLARCGRVPDCKASIYAQRYWSNKQVQKFINGQITSIEFDGQCDSFVVKGSNDVVIYGRRHDHYSCGTPFNHG